MPDFSVISQDPTIRQIVQENILERAFHDALFPRLLFRGEADPEGWAANIGDTQIFTGSGLMKVKQKPLVPGSDPVPSDWEKEQWAATLQQYANSIDTGMPTAMNAIANLFLRNAQQLGLNAGQTLNRIVRNRLFNAALSGHTVADGGQSSSTIRVKRLNGFTTARTVAGSPVRFATVSGSNPLPVTIPAGTPTTNTVVGFTPDTPGDETGPGTLSMGVSQAVSDRDAFLADNRTSLVRVGGGFKIDDVGSSDILRLADIRTAVARFQNSNVPEMPDGRYHCHLDPTSQTQIFADPEFQRLLTSLPDYFMYRQFALGELLGTVFFRNSENPQVNTVEGGSTATFDEEDPFAGELFNDGTTAGVEVHRALFIGQEAIYEYYQDTDIYITEAGVTGRVGEPTITNNGIEVMTERISLIIRAPLNRLQDQVSTSWKFVGDWPIRTDETTGDGAKFKRMVAVEHGT